MYVYTSLKIIAATCIKRRVANCLQFCNCCRHSTVWNPSHYPLPQVQRLPTSSKNVATVFPGALLHVGKSLLLALLMDHLFLFNRDTRGTHTLRHTSTQHKLLAVCYSTGSHLPPSSSSHLLYCSHLHYSPDVLCQCRVQVNKETRASASVPSPDGHGGLYRCCKLCCQPPLPTIP